ncbi:hypothetical protein HPULCUR_004035 [Helicostylum pulchrum]|uniref:Uncharacterized protein n=1 Tax=Helicostylum pulchrum TaxID=562976 RepID=A0ABP9XV16_9FUNG
MSATTDKEPQCTMELIYKDTLKMFIKSVKIVVNFKDFQAIQQNCRPIVFIFEQDKLLLDVALHTQASEERESTAVISSELQNLSLDVNSPMDIDVGRDQETSVPKKKVILYGYDYVVSD